MGAAGARQQSGSEAVLEVLLPHRRKHRLVHKAGHLLAGEVALALALPTPLPLPAAAAAAAILLHRAVLPAAAAASAWQREVVAARPPRPSRLPSPA